MAHVILQGNIKQNLTREQGLKVWNILQGTAEPEDEKQAMYCNKVVKIYLNWREAPDDYVRQHLHAIIPLALNEWRVDEQRVPVKPATEFAWDFARRHELWAHGRANMKLINGQPELAV
jgi:hypothetical protein